MKHYVAFAALCGLLTFLPFAVINDFYVDKFIDRVKPGEVWEYCYNNDSPFEPPECYRKIVIDVKDGWVQYVSEGHAGRPEYYHSRKIQHFLFGAEKVQEAVE